MSKKRSREVCADRDAAKRRLGEVLKAGERIGLKSTPKEYPEKWLDHMQDELAPSTHQEYSAVLRNHIYRVPGRQTFSRIRRAMIREIILSKRKRATTRARSGTYSLPCAMYNQAADDGEPIHNPAARIGKRNNRTDPKPDINPYSREEVATMLQKALELVPRHYPLFLCAVPTGIRQRELIALQSQDLNFETRWFMCAGL